ncbi:MAG: shikimate dehydrogenase [Halieaceae bacterium]|nr:shikimate dehydrogenase [Halieaceae bacterium]
MRPVDKYAVFGNPVRHSKSPGIHKAFAQQFRQEIQYRAILVAHGGFTKAADRFFSSGGHGLNVTVPFKPDACRYANRLSARARRAGAANTLKKSESGQILAYNTDGPGLVRDLVGNLGWEISGRQVLVLGAGGAVRGVLETLLGENPAQLTVANRTVAKARDLASCFTEFGPVRGGGFEELAGQQFDLVINGTAASLVGELPPLSTGLLTERSCCYDMMYAGEPTIFMRWAARNAAWAVADGLGMLVEQAAESFYLWGGRRPQTGPVIAAVRREMQG